MKSSSHTDWDWGIAVPSQFPFKPRVQLCSHPTVGSSDGLEAAGIPNSVDWSKQGIKLLLWNATHHSHTVVLFEVTLLPVFQRTVYILQQNRNIYKTLLAIALLCLCWIYKSLWSSEWCCFANKSYFIADLGFAWSYIIFKNNPLPPSLKTTVFHWNRL